MNNAQRLLPPHSIESEQSVLGGLMLDNDRWDDIATIVSADNFYVRPHQLIFNAMHDLLMQGKPVDLITLSEHLEQREFWNRSAASLIWLKCRRTHLPQRISLRMRSTSPVMAVSASF